MAYTQPAVQVYQDLINSGGASTTTPDMPACIVGPLMSVIDVDLSSSLSKIESLGSTSYSSQVDATLTATPVTGSNIYPNFTSAKAGQELDLDSLYLMVANPLVKTYQYTATSAVTAGDPLVLEANEIGDTTATALTVLPFYNTVSHVSLGDTVTVTTGSTTVSSYISSINYTTSTIIVNGSALAVSIDDVVTIYHKFSSLPVGSHEVPDVDGGIPYDESSFLEASATVTGYTITSEFEVEGSGDPLSIYVGYVAKRSDKSGRILTISDISDLSDQLGDITSTNPLAYAISIALANSGGTAINAIAIDPRLSERDGHTQATELAQAQRLANLVPLTQDLSIHATYKAHANAMSLPTSGNWRVALTNCALPDEDYLFGKPGSADGTDSDEYPDLLKKGVYDTTTLSVTLPRGISAPLVYPGDYLKVYILATDSYITSSLVIANGGDTIILTDDTWLDEDGALATAPIDGSTIYFYGARPSTKQGQAEWVAAQATTWSDKRMYMFPGDVTIPNDSGLDEVLPGYYLLAGLAGFISGTPPQQPITKITLAGISDLVHGNFYFTDDQMNTMAGSGTLLYAQNSQGTTPYCRHGLTTDVSVLEYREVLKVKNWDYLSYYYKDLVAPFIGSWNITSDTIQTIRQTVTSASENLLTQKLPKIGAPLLSYSIDTLEQSTTSADAIDMIMDIAIVNPNNYTNIHLQL